MRFDTPHSHTLNTHTMHTVANEERGIRSVGKCDIHCATRRGMFGG